MAEEENGVADLSQRLPPRPLLCSDREPLPLLCFACLLLLLLVLEWLERSLSAGAVVEAGKLRPSSTLVRRLPRIRATAVADAEGASVAEDADVALWPLLPLRILATAVADAEGASVAEDADLPRLWLFPRESALSS